MPKSKNTGYFSIPYVMQDKISIVFEGIPFTPKSDVFTRYALAWNTFSKRRKRKKIIENIFNDKI